MIQQLFQELDLNKTNLIKVHSETTLFNYGQLKSITVSCEVDGFNATIVLKSNVSKKILELIKKETIYQLNEQAKGVISA